MLKDFSKLTQQEIMKMSKEEFANVSPFEKRTCYDCKHLRQVLSYWCENSQAIQARGTKIPGCIKCPFWEPNWNDIAIKYKTKENGYVSIIKKIAIHSGKTLKWFKQLNSINNEKKI